MSGDSAISQPATTGIVIPTPLAISNNDLMIHGEDYAFFDYSDHENDLPTMYGDLLATATKKICIWDPYFNSSKGDSEFFVFSRINNSVKIELLSHGTSQNTRIADSIQRIRNNINVSISPPVQIEFFWISTDRYRNKYSVHDRFLIIDDSRYFLVGCSWGYHSTAVGDRGATGIFELKNAKDIRVVKDMYEKYKHIAEKDGSVNRG